jgi:hypothetical protein
MNRKEKTDYKQGERKGNIQEDSKENKKLMQSKRSRESYIEKNNNEKQQIHTGRIERRNNFTLFKQQDSNAKERSKSRRTQQTTNTKEDSWRTKENNMLLSRNTARKAMLSESSKRDGGGGEPSDGGLKGGLSPTPLSHPVFGGGGDLLFCTSNKPTSYIINSCALPLPMVSHTPTLIQCWNFRTIYEGLEPSRNRVVVPAR